jgi:hypothetical protein
MNYTCAAVGAIMLLAVVTWFASARNTFSGPEIDSVHRIVEAESTGQKDTPDWGSGDNEKKRF